MDNTENQRLKIFRTSIKKTQLEFAEAVGLKQGSYADVERGKVKVSTDIKNRLSKEFSLNIEWLMTGEGNMQGKSPRLEAKPLSLADPDAEFSTGEKIYELPDGQKVMEVKIVPARGQAGYLRGFPDPEYYEDLPTLTINVNGNHKGAYLAFEVAGDSMTPATVEDFPDAILPGWHVVGRELQRHHWSSKLHTHRHSYWIIVHKREGILIKNIKEHDVDNGTITIHSLNPAYKDEVLKLDDIEQIFSGIKRIVNDR
jgi:transcriptional regulator with XRE-family HTH domain